MTDMGPDETRFSSVEVGKRLLDHEYRVGYSGVVCDALVVRDGGGDACGHSYDEHPATWAWNDGTKHAYPDPDGGSMRYFGTRHNLPNRVLTALRRVAIPGLEHMAVAEFLTLLESNTYGIYAGHHSYDALVIASDAEREHAKKVLHRYESIYSLSNGQLLL